MIKISRGLNMTKANALNLFVQARKLFKKYD